MHFKEYKTILSPNNGMNIYRGCTHGCIYCDSRSICYQMDHDFTDIEIKKDAPLILENQLKKRRSITMIGTGSMCDPYIPLEKEIKYTRQCLEVVEKYGFGITIITKSSLILRDLDLLMAINKKAKCVVQMTLTTFDEKLCKILEPNVATAKERFEVLKVLRDNNIATVVWLSPILPFINDTVENINGLLNYCKMAKVWGILNFGMGLTLREGNREYFYNELDKNFPGLKCKYIKKFGNNYSINSENNETLKKIFYTECYKNNIIADNRKIFEFLHYLPPKFEQLSFF